MRDYKYGDLYFDTQNDKQMKIDVVGTGIVIDNSMIEMEAFELDETLCSESELKFGRCEANCVKFTARNLPGSINGKTINITETIDGNTDEPFPYGKYKVYSDVPTSDRTKREITAYDAMYDIINADVKSWYVGLTFPMTLRQFRDTFFTHLGITQKETTLVNDGMTVNKTLITESSSDSNVTEVDSISGKTVVEAICEINGAFGNINRDGEFEYVILKPIISGLYPANDLYPRNDLFPRDPNTVSMSGHYITFDYEDFKTKKITQLEIRPSDNTVGEKVGEAGNNYVISGNFLVSDKSGAELNGIAQNVLEVIGKVSYTPIKSSSCVGNPCLELGDPIRFNTSREIVESYILQRTLTGIQAKRDSIESHGVEVYPVNNNGIKKRVEDVENRADSLEQTADEIQEDVEEFKSETTVRFETTENSIEAEVTRATGAEGELSGRITLSEDAINAEVSRAMGAEGNLSSRISLTESSIDAEVSRAMGAESSLSGRITITESSITQEVNRATVAEGNLSGRIDVEAGNIALKVDKNGIISAINLSSEQASIDSSKINLNGYVTVSSLESDGTTNIDGARITTGYISCDRLSGGTLQGAIIKLGNTLYMYNPKIGDYQEVLSFDGNYPTFYPNDIHFENTIYAEVIGSLIGNASSANSAGSAKRCESESSNSHTANCFISDSLIVYKVPSGSSRRFKTDVCQVVDANLDPHRLYGLEIVQFKYKPSFYNLPDGTDMPTVIGIIAEDVDEKYPCACEYDEDTGEVINWLERYMIPPMLALIQEQHTDIEKQKQEILALQNRVSKLEMEMEEIKNVINNKNN